MASQRITEGSQVRLLSWGEGMCSETCKSGAYFCGVVLSSWSPGFLRVGWEMERHVGTDGGDPAWHMKPSVLHAPVVTGSHWGSGRGEWCLDSFISHQILTPDFRFAAFWSDFSFYTRVSRPFRSISFCMDTGKQREGDEPLQKRNSRKAEMPNTTQRAGERSIKWWIQSHMTIRGTVTARRHLSCFIHCEFIAKWSFGSEQKGNKSTRNELH